MIKVLVAEDEPAIARHLKKIIHEVHPSFEVIGIAQQGQEAIQIIGEHHPHVLFTDIKMPLVDGLELLKHIHENQIEIIPVVLSAHKEFEYAQKAIQFKVLEYLTKPIEKAALKTLLIRIKERFEQSRLLSEKLFFSKVLNADVVGEGILDIPLDYSGYHVVTVCAGAFPLGYTVKTKDFLQKLNLKELSQNLLAPSEKVWQFNGKYESEKILIFGFKQPPMDFFNRMEKGFFPELLLPEVIVNLVVSPFFTNVRELNDIVNQSRSTMRRNIVIGLSQVFPMEENGKKYIDKFQGQLQLISSELENHLVTFIRNKNIDGFKQAMQSLFKQWVSEKYPQILVERLLKFIVTLCQRTIGASGDIDAAYSEQELNEAISTALSYENLFDGSWYIFEDMFKRQPEIVEPSPLLEKIEDFMHANLTQSLNTQTIAHYFHLKPSYISRLFKRYKGTTPAQYFVQLRINRAKEFIQSSLEVDLKVVAANLGYDDYYYFSRVFKKKTGMWPSDFRQSIALKNE